MQIAISQTIKNEVKDYFYITLGLLIYTFGWTIFLLPYQIVTGGVTGIAAVIYYGTGIPIYLSYFLINAALLLAALKILGFKFMVKTIYAKEYYGVRNKAYKARFKGGRPNGRYAV